MPHTVRNGANNCNTPRLLRRGSWPRYWKNSRLQPSTGAILRHRRHTGRGCCTVERNLGHGVHEAGRSCRQRHTISTSSCSQVWRTVRRNSGFSCVRLRAAQWRSQQGRPTVRPVASNTPFPVNRRARTSSSAAWLRRNLVGHAPSRRRCLASLELE